MDNLKRIVEEQANDEGLWFIAQYASEEYLQAALRRLHAEIEKGESIPIPWKIANEEYLVLKVIQNLFDRQDCVAEFDSYDDTMTIRKAVNAAIAKAEGKC